MIVAHCVEEDDTRPGERLCCVRVTFRNRRGQLPQYIADVKVKTRKQTRLFILRVYVVPDVATQQRAHAFGIWAARIKLGRLGEAVEAGVNSRKRFAILRARRENTRGSYRKDAHPPGAA